MGRKVIDMEAPRKERVAHAVAVPEGKPVINDKQSKLPILLRQHAADKFFEILIVKRNQEDAIKMALEYELDLYNSTKKKTVYKNSLLSKLNALKSNKPMASIEKASQIRFEEAVNRLEDMLVPVETLAEIGFPCLETGIFIERLPNQEVECSRCKKPFIPDTYYELEDPESCNYHYGRLQNVKNHPTKIFSCCNAEASGTHCSTASKHVFFCKTLFSDDSLLKCDWSQTAEQLDLVALDGEMCHTEAGMELCRLTMVTWDETRLLDVIIKPTTRIIDYNTRFSGISEETFVEGSFETVVPEGITPKIFSFEELRSVLLPRLIGPQTILVGHSLENDLFYMKLDHKRIIDTCVLYPHNKGHPYRMALRDLSRVHLKQFVQEGSSGHDSFEDCVACLRLLKIKL